MFADDVCVFCPSVHGLLTPWRLGGFGDFRKKKQQFLVALPTP